LSLQFQNYGIQHRDQVQSTRVIILVLTSCKAIFRPNQEQIKDKRYHRRRGGQKVAVDEVLDLCKEAEKSTTAFLCPHITLERSGFSNQVYLQFVPRSPCSYEQFIDPEISIIFVRFHGADII
jgi:hypothetical protein